MGLTTMAALVRDTAEEMGTTNRAVKEVIDTFFDTVALELEAGNDVRVGTFVKFTHSYQFPVKKGTPVRNPQTGEMRPSDGRPAKIRIRARALKSLQDAAPNPMGKAGKPIADKAKSRRAASAAKVAA